VREIAKDRAVLLIEHRAEVSAVADRVVRLEAGVAVDAGVGDPA
jgi:ABC-type transport system involved in cytochrome bd biosynthesis fused ATPase/permease subunit